MLYLKQAYHSQKCGAEKASVEDIAVIEGPAVSVLEVEPLFLSFLDGLDVVLFSRVIL